MTSPQLPFGAPDPDAAHASQQTLLILGHSGLFDVQFYLRENPDLRALGTRLLAHYHENGWQEGRRPNPCFDPLWYRAEYPGVIGDPLLHYIREGEAQGFQPVAWFSPGWYRQTYAVPDGMMLLAHYLQNRHRGDVSPMPEFDPTFYLSTYHDVAEAGLDPAEHYMIQGFREIRRPFPGFDPQFYRTRYLREAPDENPFLHYLANRTRADVFPAMPAHEHSIPREVARNTRPSTLFENPVPLPAGVRPRARILAYYLPQFHTIDANDNWWGKGFTEWTNVARGLPRFVGHYQPRTPRDLGHYTLDATIMQRQIDLARNSGIEGFVFYFYWFNGRRLLENPLEILLATPELDVPFCLMWANENWTRSWDGSDQEILVAQDYGAAGDEEALADCLARYMADPRYIRVAGRPVLMIYRPGAIPDAGPYLRRLRTRLTQHLGVVPMLIMAQAFKDTDPRAFDLDGAIEFPPHGMADRIPQINDQLHLLDSEFSGQVFAYEDVVDLALTAPEPEFPLIRTACPSWDNDARREGKGLVLHGSTPALYERWLSGLIDQAQTAPFLGEPIVCINAWNEWAEGAYLEPDQHFGSAYLNATARAASRFDASLNRSNLLLVGHDAFPAGAQMLLLAIARALHRQHGFTIHFVLLDGGALMPAYRALGPVTILPEGSTERLTCLKQLAAQKFRSAIVNSAASSPIALALHEAGIDFTLLVHELPGVLGHYRLEQAFLGATQTASAVLYPARSVQQAMRHLAHPQSLSHIAPQGLYTSVSFKTADRRSIRRSGGIDTQDRVVIGIGHADMRKGFDLFLHLWRQQDVQPKRSGTKTHFVWIGALSPVLADLLKDDLTAALASGTFHMPGHLDSVAPWLSAADAFALTSREDPFPSVVLEALSAGLPCVAFEKSGGIPDLLAQINASNGERSAAPQHACVRQGDTPGMLRALVRAADATLSRRSSNRAATARAMAAQFDFPTYATQLAQRACPALRQISVVVLSYNYARFLRTRLLSIFCQSHPVLEIIVLDDASTDESVAVATAVAHEAGRDIRIVRAESNSGNVFHQWREATRLARGDWIWLAEADDSAEPGLLPALTAALDRAPNAVMAFADSRAVDEQDHPVFDSYQPYYRNADVPLLAQDGVHDGAAFVEACLEVRNLILNASSALFQRDALAATLERLGPEILHYRAAGDWRLYLDLLSQPDVQIAYVASPQNIHRRHGSSTTTTTDHSRQLQEIRRIHDLLDDAALAHDAALAPTARSSRAAQREAYRDELLRQFSASNDDSAIAELG